MSKPIPVDVIPSHVYLSQADQAVLFGVGHPMTIAQERSQAGQYVYEESVEILGKLKRSLNLRVLGPNWENSIVEVTSTEAVFLGLNAPIAKTGDTTLSAPCKLVGPDGEVDLKNAVSIPFAHLMCSPDEADSMNIRNGQKVAVDIIGEKTRILEDILVRVHPTFRLRLEINQDTARDMWITRPTHARLRD
ncbi:MAG: PduL/EutD family phosphate acyltransferase [Candidatus Uhrbacteria bacterium]|nr:PduL/EutD family phosphate acyltransferase [Candidatus Uhrbacteria bacterium]